MVSRYLYTCEVRHEGLNKYKVVKGETKKIAEQKANAQMAQWEEQWKRKQEADRKRKEREKYTRSIEESTEEANKLTLEAEEMQNSLDTILIDNLDPRVLDYDSLKDHRVFDQTLPVKPKHEGKSTKPSREDVKYNQKLSFLQRLSRKQVEKQKTESNSQFEKDYKQWEDEEKKKDLKYDQMLADYEIAYNEWCKQEETFFAEQKANNDRIDQLKKDFELGEVSAIENYFEHSIEDIKLPLDFALEVELEYQIETKMLIVDILLPTVDDLPRLKKITFIKNRNELKESFLSDSVMNAKYDSVIYQTVLVCFNSIFGSDKYGKVESVVINGKVSTIDKATGNHIEPYILSINVKKEDFKILNLSSIDPKAWFRNEKGIAAAKLSFVTPVPPVIVLNKEDRRFIEGYGVIVNVDDSINLATMDWQDFENLIREVFEWEFSTNGGEVKITQASRDKGVDAVAFDPDPIKGGKIVIQAKRYTNVVGVSAVRDLYGTILNEGANKGILVSTSNYGNDAYEFAKDKPITLMNGSNLLYLLEKHGHKARIDIKEAKKQLYAK
ncbi:MAG TPA: restriction endonuclease [Methanosarcina sp.]|jgi:restriction system protein|nr:restriction endonuclease [Methanosarcina sp.]